jgi:hypothetical protein
MYVCIWLKRKITTNCHTIAFYSGQSIILMISFWYLSKAAINWFGTKNPHKVCKRALLVVYRILGANYMIDCKSVKGLTIHIFGLKIEMNSKRYKCM